MKQYHLVFLLIIMFLFSCTSTDDNPLPENTDSTSSLTKPKGVFTSSFGNSSALDHEAVNGALIRFTWSEIEPQEGVYNFASIEEEVAIIKSKGLKWSLGIIGGGSSPNWLTESFGANYFEITYQNNIKKIPKIWDSKVNEKLSALATALANRFGEDDDLQLVYVPQMTTNGIEGHFNGVSPEELINAGFTKEKWINSVKQTARIFANAFKNKAIAVELHDIMNDTSIPTTIMNDLWNDDSLNQRVGVAMWWISGKTTYQPNLVNALIDFPGDIYAQAIGRSDQTQRFKDNDYTTMFNQAQVIGIRYIELWEYEFVNNTFSQEFENFNIYANTNFD